jgi:hypothetical protein
MQYYTLDYETFDKFYAMYDPIDPWNLTEDDSYLCPECGRILVWTKWAEPRCVKLTKPLFGDVVLDFHDMLVSQRFKDLYEKSDLKGITAFHKLDKVLVSGNAKKQLEPPTYYYIETAVANAIFDPERTTVVLCDESGENHEIKYGVKRCRLCKPYNYNIHYIRGFGIKYLDDDLLDIFGFYPRAKYKHFSQRFVDWALENNITNFKGKIIRIEEYTTVPEETTFDRLEQDMKARLKQGEEF